MTGTGRLTILAALAGALTLSGCGRIPDLRGSLFGAGSAPRAAAPAYSATPLDPMAPDTGAPDTGAPVPAGAAEQACVAVAQEQGLAVQSVVGTREVAGADGLPESRDVMLRVMRGEQAYDVRCNYHYGGAAARIMSL